MARRVVVIGNGIAGITAAREIRKRSADDEITVISAETDHFFSRTALMYVYMGHMSYADTKPYADDFWEQNRIGLRRAWVECVEPRAKRVRFSDGQHLSYDVLIVASGSKSNQFGWSGQELEGVQGLYGYPDLELMERNTRDVDRAVVVGGGLIGVEVAEMLLSRGIGVTFLVREQGWMDHAFPPEESAMIGREIRRHGIDLRLATEIERILPDERGRACAVLTRQGERLDCGFVALTVGVSPNVAFLEGSGIETDRGVLVDRFLRTSAEDIYAAGDCVQLRETQSGRRAIEPVWYVGRKMGETLAETLCGTPTAYDQGIWFNSAKFFDLEWQVYGDVPAEAPAGVERFYWEDPGGRRALRIDHDADAGAVRGFNVLGIRYRHELCEQWIRHGTPLREVLADLGAANFDPEFHRQSEGEIIAAWNREHPGSPVTLRRRRGLRSLLGVRRAS